MNLEIKYGLPFTVVVFSHRDKTLTIDNILIDTGSASTIILMLSS